MEVIVVIIVLCFIGFGLLISHGLSEQQLATKRLQALSMSNVDQMRGIDFELYAAALLENEGFTDVRVTRASGDNGVDIIASRGERQYAIQAKRYKGTVSRRAVSDAVAGMVPYHCNACMVITSGRLSPKSRDFARLHGCEIVDRDVLADWIRRFQLVYGVSHEEKPVVDLATTHDFQANCAQQRPR
jgi:HJR/Mrr/RecB family endonuclease